MYKKNAHCPDVCASLLKTYVSLLIVPASGAFLLEQLGVLALPAADDDGDSFGLCISASLVVKYCMYHMTEEFFSS